MRARFALVALLGVVACGGAEAPSPVSVSPIPAFAGQPVAAKPSTPAPAQAPKEVPLSEKIARFSPAKVTADVSKLPKAERDALDHLIAASKLLDPIFDRQAYAQNPELRAKLAQDTSAEGKDKLAYFDIMRGPWDRQDHFRPFAIDIPRPLGGGFYPSDLTADEFKKWVADHPDDKKAFEDLTTVIVRDGKDLKAKRFGEVYAEWLKPAAEHMEKAAKATKNRSLAKFLRSRAAAFSSDDYYQSDKDWMDLDSIVEVTIGPYETYEDELFSYKASFESFVTVADPAASKDLAKYKKLLPEMEQHLPVPDEVKTKRGAESPIRVVDLVFSAGDARKSVQTIAFNLPNDERVRSEKGAKKVMLRNVIQTKFDLIMRPIAERILDPSHLPYLSADAFFNEVLFHELSHSLGPAFTMKDGKKVEVRIALEAAQSALEEGKADVMGAYNVLFMIDRGEFPKDFRDKLLVSYFAGLFRSTRFGVSEAHGKGAAMQINRFIEAGAASVDANGRFKIDLPKLEAAIKDLVRDICMIQHKGDKAAAEALLAKYGVVSEPMKHALSGLSDVPVDLRPSYPLAGE